MEKSTTWTCQQTICCQKEISCLRRVLTFCLVVALGLTIVWFSVIDLARQNVVMTQISQTDTLKEMHSDGHVGTITGTRQTGGVVTMEKTRRTGQVEALTETRQDGKVMTSENTHGDSQVETGTVGKSHQDRTATPKIVQGTTQNIKYSARTLCSNNRTNQIRDVCIRKGWNSGRWRTDRTYRTILVDDAHRVLYCVIPKVGCSSMKTMLVKSSPSFHRNYKGKLYVHFKWFLNQHKLRYLASYSAPKIKEKMATYRKFMLVRHPFDRLYSAYKDKILTDKMKRRPITELIYKLNPGIKHIHELSFEDFLKAVVYNPGKFRDIHWRPFVESCQPCHIRYDRVINLEAVDEGLPHILTWLNTSLPMERRNIKTQASSDSKLRMVSEKMRDIDDTTMQKIMKLYGRDFELFGYSWSRTAGANLTTYKDCSTAVQGGHGSSE